MYLIKSAYLLATLYAVSGIITSKNPKIQHSKNFKFLDSRDYIFGDVQKSPGNLEIDIPQSHPLHAPAAHDSRDLNFEADLGIHRYVSKAVVPPIQPARPFSAGIFQDGNDYTYFAEVFLGSQSSKVYMLLDTGADSSWVMGSGCKDPICTSRETYGTQNSSTFEASDTIFSVNYGSGSCSGFLAKDTISFADFSFTMPFGSANRVSKEFGNFEIDGILGLSFSKSKTPSFIDSVVASKTLKSNLFAMSLSQTKDGINTGVINFGSPDTTRFIGDLKYYPLTGNKADWKIELTAAGFGGKQFPMGLTTLLDTGATNMFAPISVAEELYVTVPGAETRDEGSNWRVPCNSTVNLEFKFESDVYSLPPTIWVGPPTSTDGQCWSNLSGTNQTNDEWVLGDYFLKKYYVVFDIDKRRIGIADVKIPTPSSMPSPSPTEGYLDHPKEDGPITGSGTNSTTQYKSVSAGPQSTNHILLLLSIPVGFVMLFVIF